MKPLLALLCFCVSTSYAVPIVTAIWQQDGEDFALLTLPTDAPADMTIAEYFIDDFRTSRITTPNETTTQYGRLLTGGLPLGLTVGPHTISIIYYTPGGTITVSDDFEVFPVGTTVIVDGYPFPRVVPDANTVPDTGSTLWILLAGVAALLLHRSSAAN